MEWTKTNTLKFIELWQGFPCLWNNKIADYKNRQKRRDAFLNLSQQMNVDADLIEKKILSLKTQYNRELNKLKTKSRVGLDGETYSSWYAFERLHFLKDHNVPQPNTDPLMITKTENKPEDSITDKNENRQQRILTFTQRQTQPRCTLKRKYDTQLGTLTLVKDASNAFINKQNKDEFSIFGETIASELRDIKNKRESLILKKEIMDLIFKTKLKILDSENIVSQPPVEQDIVIEGIMDHMYEDTSSMTATAEYNSP